ncbi:MAG: transporter substrate-binding domain-containing protein, partial [Caldilineaceae bacterium]|nr:transporter substrate-binding domain-containing protein [Caldilineaceae bacterium]
MPLAIGLPLDDPTFRELVDITLQEMKTDGAYDAIYHTWFGENATSYPITIIPGDAGYLLSNLNTLAFTPRVKAAGESAIARIQKRADVLRVGVATDLAPFGYRNAAGELTGFDVELVQAIAQDWGVQLDLVPVTPADRIPKLLSGEIDMIAAGLQRNKAQAADIDFSQTYFLGGTSLLVKSNVGIQAITDLNDRVVAVVENVETGDQLQAVAEANNVAVAITPYPSLDDALVALGQGDVAAILGDSVVLSQARKDDLILLNNLLNTTPY